MKLLKYILIIFLVGAVNSSCTLDRASYSEIYPENFFQNESDVKKALTALYNQFSSDWGKLYCADQYSYTTCTEFSTDVMKCSWLRYEGFYEHQWTADGTDMGSNFAVKMYTKYNTLSRIRSTMMKISESPASDALKTKSLAEAKCLYAWFGIIMYDLFGPVPLATDEAILNPQIMTLIPRLSDQEYCAIMEKNLLEAIDVLDVKPAEFGRVSKGMARMLLLKLYMINKDFVKSEKVARDLYAMEADGTYGLLTEGYDKVFSREFARNKEIIHAIPCGTGLPNYWLAEVMPSDYPYPTKITGWGGYKMSWTFFDTFESKDLRLKTIISQYVSSTSNTTITRGNGALKDGAIPMKYAYDANMVGSTGTLDCIVFRYADVLLSLAECINENMGGPTNEAIALVNRVRARAGLDPLTLVQTASKDAFNDAILTERGHEFYCEGLRRQDLIRHNKFVSTSLSLYPNSRSAGYKVRFPIPSTFINESKGIVKQNPGY